MNTMRKTAWITGASSGIGKALAKLLASKGFSLILSGRNEQELLRLKEELNTPVLLLVFDLSKVEEDWSWIVPEIQQFTPRLDYWFCNAGVGQRGLSVDTTVETERYLFNINYFSAVKIFKLIFPVLKSTENSHVILTSSVSAKYGYYARSTYSATKHALHGYFESVRYECPFFNINFCCLGRIQTSFSNHALDSEGGVHNKSDHKNRMTPEDCVVKIWDAVSKNKREVYIGGRETLPARIKGIFPYLSYWMLKKSIG